MVPSEAPSTNPLLEHLTGQADLRLPDVSLLDAQLLVDNAEAIAKDMRVRLDRLLAQTEEPSFHNTTVAIDLVSEPMTRLAALMRMIEGNLHGTPLAEAVAPVSATLVAARTALLHDEALFARLEAVSTAHLNPEDKRHHELMLRDFARAGARLRPEARARVAEITAELDSLSKQFAGAVAAESRDLALHVTEESRLDGLSASEKDAAAHAAELAGLPGWLLTLVSSTQQPAMTRLTDPAVRAELLERSLARGSRGNDADTRGLVTRMTALRAELASLLGHKTFAGYVVDDETAGNADDVGDLLSTLLAPTLTRLDGELTKVVTHFGVEGLGIADVAHFVEGYKREVFSFDASATAEYFEYSRVLRDGAFYAASRLYGVDFVQVEGHPVWHPDVEVYEAREGDKVIGLICVDPFTRDSKRGGAWMDQLVNPGRLTGERPLLTMQMNIPAPAQGSTALLTLDQTRTLFHEFGHVLHALFSDSTYPSRAGTAVPRDYVEFPSQLNELWMLHPEVLGNYAKHVETGEPIPESLVSTIRASFGFGQSFWLAEQLAAAILDLSWHNLEAGEHIDDVLSFDSEVLAAMGFDTRIPPRYRSPYFSHVFAGDYAADYYSYVWSEILAADFTETFEAHGLDADLGRAFRELILAPGNSIDPMSAVETFAGERPGISALLRRRGLAELRAPRH